MSLTKRQLEDAARCMIIDCEDCSVYCINTIEVTRRAARTALELRTQVTRMRKALTVANNYMPDIGHFCTCGQCKKCGADINYASYGYCLRCARNIIDAALSDTPKNKEGGKTK